jgi:hypothetical protein
MGGACPWGSNPCTLLFLELRADVEEILPLLDGYQKIGFSSQWGPPKVGFPFNI